MIINQMNFMHALINAFLALSDQTFTFKESIEHGRVGESVESALSALAAIFSALNAYFNNFRQKVPYFDVSRQKRVLFNCFATKQCLGIAENI